MQDNKQTNIQTVAVIGLDKAGSEAASASARAGFPTNGWDKSLNNSYVRNAAAAEVDVKPTLRQAVENVKYIFISREEDRHELESLVLEPGGIVDIAQPNAIIINLNTIGTRAAHDLARNLEQRHMRLIDAPILGSETQTDQGNLTLLASGSTADVEECQPLLNTISSTVFYCGEVGTGQTIKLCNQLLYGIQLLAFKEALQLAEQLNVDPELMLQICSATVSSELSDFNQDVAPAVSNTSESQARQLLQELKLISDNVGNDIHLSGFVSAKELLETVYHFSRAQQMQQALITRGNF